MTQFLIGLLAGAIAFAVILIGGRHEPTAHGQSVIALVGAVAGAVVALIYWVGAIIWAVVL